MKGRIVDVNPVEVGDPALHALVRAFDPPPPDDEDDMALAKIMIPTGSWAKDWYPHLACFDSGVIRPSMSSDLNPREGKGEVTDEGQYRRSCDAAGIQLTTPLPE
jgi:hypothetical protein